MNAFKKMGGYILLIIAALLSVAVLVTLPADISRGLSRISASGSIGVTYFAGTIVGNVIFAWIIFYLAKSGLRMIRSKPDENGNIKKITNIK